MRIKTKISLRIDDDLLKILKEYSSNNLTACIESLIWKGLMTDLAEANQQLTLAKASKNLENNQSNDFEKEMLERTATKVKDSAAAAEFLHSEIALFEGDEPRGRVLKRGEL